MVIYIIVFFCWKKRPHVDLTAKCRTDLAGDWDNTVPDILWFDHIAIIVIGK